MNCPYENGPQYFSKNRAMALNAAVYENTKALKGTVFGGKLLYFSKSLGFYYRVFKIKSSPGFAKYLRYDMSGTGTGSVPPIPVPIPVSLENIKNDHIHHWYNPINDVYCVYYRYQV